VRFAHQFADPKVIPKFRDSAGSTAMPAGWQSRPPQAHILRGFLRLRMVRERPIRRFAARLDLCRAGAHDRHHGHDAPSQQCVVASPRPVGTAAGRGRSSPPHQIETTDVASADVTANTKLAIRVWSEVLVTMYQWWRNRKVSAQVAAISPFCADDLAIEHRDYEVSKKSWGIEE